jgi:hypothetical protein
LEGEEYAQLSKNVHFVTHQCSSGGRTPPSDPSGQYIPARRSTAIALGLKAVFLVTTLFGVTTLWMAILADTGATVLVTANALRLLAYKPSK